MLHVLCETVDKEKILHLLFQHTTTIGVRESITHRYILDRHVERVETPYGEVRRKISAGYGVSRQKYEYDDLACIAKALDISLNEAEKLLENA